jgi:hypothetical protein
MGLFTAKKKEPVLRQKDAYEVEIPEGMMAKKVNESKFEIVKDESAPINGTGRPVNE